MLCAISSCKIVLGLRIDHRLKSANVDRDVRDGENPASHRRSGSTLRAGKKLAGPLLIG